MSKENGFTPDVDFVIPELGELVKSVISDTDTLDAEAPYTEKCTTPCSAPESPCTVRACVPPQF